MRAALALTLLLSWTSAADSDPADPVVARAGGSPVTASDLARWGARRGDEDSVRAALLAARIEATLADEATTMLGARVASLSRVDAARALMNHLHGPATCSRIPDRMLEEHFAATRWRFQAPPSWSVEDLQLLCCDSPEDCLRPEVSQCVVDRGREASALAARLSTATPREGVISQEVERVRSERRQAASSAYRFYFDPQTPDAPMDGRLQTVDRPIATAVASSRPGEWVGPVATRFGQHLLRVTGRLPGISLSFDDPRTQAVLRTELCPAFLAQQRARYAAELTRPLAWQVDDETLSRMFGTGSP